MHDKIKDKVLILNEVPIYRFKTNEANEEERLKCIFNKLFD